MHAHVRTHSQVSRKPRQCENIQRRLRFDKSDFLPAAQDFHHGDDGGGGGVKRKSRRAAALTAATLV